MEQGQEAARYKQELKALSQEGRAAASRQTDQLIAERLGRRGYSREQIQRALMQASPNLATRTKKAAYARTIANQAVNKVQREHYQAHDLSHSLVLGTRNPKTIEYQQAIARTQAILHGTHAPKPTIEQSQDSKNKSNQPSPILKNKDRQDQQKKSNAFYQEHSKIYDRQTPPKNEQERLEKDFSIACDMVRANYSDAQIRQTLVRHGASMRDCENDQELKATYSNGITQAAREYTDEEREQPERQKAREIQHQEAAILKAMEQERER